MVRSVVIARAYDGLPLAASMDDDDVFRLFYKCVYFNYIVHI